jgi:hypothetical protein
LNAWPSSISHWRWGWLRPEFRDQPQNLLEHLPWDGNLGHLESDVTAVAHDLRADLDQLLLQAGQRPLLDRLGQRQRSHEVCEIAGQRMKLKPDGVEGAAADAFVGHQGKEALDHVVPGGRGRGIVETEARMPFELALDHGSLNARLSY